jgi:glycosyltransferase involved in cell wall biosynthesis
MTKIYNPIISVVMSVYNGEKYLNDAIGSIINQTFSDFEFIIINDGSTDSTQMIIDSYNDCRIRKYYQQNMGLTKALNRGLKIAEGKYIARQDADDISLAQRFCYQVDFLNKNKDVGLVGTHAAAIDSNGKEIGIWKTPISHNKISEQLKRGNSFAHGSVMLRKKTIQEIGGYREKFMYTQDYDLWLRISEKFKTANIGKVLYRSRRTSKSISKSKLSDQINFHILAQQLAKERQEGKRDSLEKIDTNNIGPELIKIYQMEKGKIKKIKSQIYLNHFSESLKTKEFICALQLWTYAFFLDPKKWKIRYLIRNFVNEVI